MNNQLAIEKKKKDSLVPASSLDQHATVKTVLEHFVQSGPVRNVNGSRFRMDFSQVPVLYPSSTIRSENAQQPCALSPRTCPFGGACDTCPGRVQKKLAINQPGDENEQEADRVADQVTRAQMPQLQRRAKSQGELTHVPFIVHEVLGSPGYALDAETRSYMEPRFGRDFSQVRVHTDVKAAESARAVNALAYTVGQDIVFETGQYPPVSTVGQKLLAHELAHVVEQANGISRGQLQRQPHPRPAPVDADAQRIIDLAADTSRPINQRAIAVVRAIIDQYFPNDASKISSIVYKQDKRGLQTSYTGRGVSITGIIEVGDDFVNTTTQANFARRVLQVRHEIEHVEQERRGMIGASRQDEREFIAFYHEALARELAGTGRMQHATRVNLIDAALGYYFCLSPDLQQGNTSRRDELVARRDEEVRRSHRSDLGAVPSSCHRQPH